MKRYIYRYFWFIAGLLVNSFGIAFITKAAMGTSPISSLPYVLSLQFPLTFGQFTFIVNMFFIAGQLFLLKKSFQPIQFFQIAVNVIFSFCIDVSMNLLSWLQPSQLVPQLASLTAGCMILAFGICIEVAPKVLMVPGEGMVSAITHTSGQKFGTVKVLFDVTLVLMALFLSFLFFHRLNGLGLGTILSALLVGKFVNLFNQKIPLISYISRLQGCHP